MIHLKFVLGLLFLACIYTSNAQSRTKIILVLKTEISDKKVSKLFDYQKEHKDSLSAIRELRKVILKFQSSSFVAAGIDSISFSGDTLLAYLDPGPTVKWTKLKKGNVNDYILSKVGFKERFFRNTPFSYNEFSRLTELIIKYSENNGYPFATISLDSIQFSGSSQIEASLNYKQGPLIKFDSIDIVGKTKLKKKFLASYLRIFPGQNFNQERINNIDNLLKEMPYLKVKRPYTIIFNNNKAIVTLFIDDKKSNQIDGIIGFLPNQTSTNKLLVTGELNLRLRNLFGSGKGFSGEWKKYNQSSQLLNLSYFHPRLLAANMDVKIDFNLLKQDSSFIAIDRKLTFIQRTGRNGNMQFSGGLKTSNQLSNSNLISNNDLPIYSDFRLFNYGLGYEWKKLDALLFPHKGNLISVQGIIGNKNTQKNSLMPDSVNKRISANSVQFNFNFLNENYLKIGRNGVLLSRVSLGKVVNNQNNLFYNDLYRLGGLRTLRGFNENFFYSSSYAIGTVEYRYFTEETSYLLLFIDQGFINNSLSTTIPVDYPFGFGAGVSFVTPAGLFNFVYSMGSSKTQRISLNLSKIHFGLISRF